MAGLFRVGISKIGANNSVLGLCKTSPVTCTQVAFITGRTNRLVERPPKPPPFNYKEKTYNFWRRLMDPMMERIDENSKIIVVEGNLAVGKTKFAKALAEELEMKYLPPPTMDDLYINKTYGYDFRKLDHKLPPKVQTVDVEKFLTNPTHPAVQVLQHHFYKLRLWQYLNALVHLFSTGEGIVMERCVFSDIVFMLTMFKKGYNVRGSLDSYQDERDATTVEILRPHLVIYLDVPAEEVKARIQKRGIPYEVNSKVLTVDYLQEIENNYKQVYLKQMSRHSHVLLYDWTGNPDWEAVVEDIEKLNFDNFERDDPKLLDWRFEMNDAWREHCHFYNKNKMQLFFKTNIPRFDCKELIATAEEEKAVYELYRAEIPGFDRYQDGFNPEMGDKNLLFSWK